MSTEREALIEEAVRAMAASDLQTLRYMDDHTLMYMYADQARAALAVFEKAQAPTETANLEIVNGWLVERGAMPLEYPGGAAYGAMPYSDAEPWVRLDNLPGWPGVQYADTATVMIAASMIAGENAELMERLADTATEPTDVRFMARQGGKVQPTIDALLAQANEQGVRVEVVYPQAEPTDEQVEAAAIALWVLDAFVNAHTTVPWVELSEGRKEYWRDFARAALKAAGEVKP